jgi:flagellar export protein FliJ
MRKFRFRLEQVLHVRRVQEDMARAEVMNANRAAHDAADRVRQSIAEYQTRVPTAATRSYQEFETALFFADTAAGAVGVARQAHLDAMDVVYARRADWYGARRRVDALERLEDRRRAEHELETRRAEDRLVDDLVMARYATTVGARTRGASQ